MSGRRKEEEEEDEGEENVGKVYSKKRRTNRSTHHFIHGININLPSTQHIHAHQHYFHGNDMEIVVSCYSFRATKLHTWLCREIQAVFLVFWVWYVWYV